MKFRLSDDGVNEIIEADSMEEAVETAEENWQGGSWDTKGIVDVRVAALDDGGEETGECSWVEVECGDDPEEPDCPDSDGHDWQAVFEVVGGLRENPGVFNAGGTTTVTRECCAHCGRYRRATNYGSQRDPGLVDTVNYFDADESSLAWVEKLT